MPLSVENEVSNSQAMGTSQINASSARIRWRMTEKMPFFHFALLELLLRSGRGYSSGTQENVASFLLIKWKHTTVNTAHTMNTIMPSTAAIL